MLHRFYVLVVSVLNANTGAKILLFCNMSANFPDFFLCYMAKHVFSVMKHPYIIIIKYVTTFYVFGNTPCFVIEKNLPLRHLFEENNNFL